MCTAAASQRDVLPAACDDLELHRGVTDAARGAEQAALVALIITSMLKLEHKWGFFFFFFNYY